MMFICHFSGPKDGNHINNNGICWPKEGSWVNSIHRTTKTQSP